MNQEFVRVGYYVNNEYESLDLRANPPPTPIFDRMTRNILMQKPRITRFQIKWDGNPNEPPSFPPETMLYSEMSNSMPDVEVMMDDSIPEPKRTGPDFTEKLTPELSKLVFQHLLVEDLGRCRRVSKRWKELIDSGVEWRYFYYIGLSHIYKVASIYLLMSGTKVRVLDKCWNSLYNRVRLCSQLLLFPHVP
jgi:hypothetical protein